MKLIDDMFHRPGGCCTLREFADLSRLSRSRVYGLMRQGELDYVQVGRKRFVRLTAWGRNRLEHMKAIKEGE